MDFSTPHAVTGSPDLTGRTDFGEAMADLVDQAIVRKRSKETPRTYLGGSRLGNPLADKPMDRGCDRALWYEYHNTPKDPGRDFSGKLYRIFDMGHDIEDRMAAYLRMAGFKLLTENPRDGSQFGFGVAKDPETGEPRIAGHIDGVFVDGPATLTLGDQVIPLEYPFLWECKGINDKKFGQLTTKGLASSHVIYHAQVQIYMAYMELTQAPALLTAINRNTGEVAYVRVPFDARVAQAASDRGVRVISARQASDLPRVMNEKTHLPCKWCDYKERCWAEPAPAATGPTTTAAPNWLRPAGQ